MSLNNYVTASTGTFLGYYFLRSKNKLVDTGLTVMIFGQFLDVSYGI